MVASPSENAPPAAEPADLASDAVLPPGADQSIDATELERLRSGRTHVHRRIEIACLAGYFTVAPFLVARIVMVAVEQHVPYLPLVVLAGLFVGLVWADIGSGFIHWLADNWGHPDMPIIGQAIIRSFRHHHVAPKDMTTHDFIELNGIPSLFGQIPMAVGFACTELSPTMAVFGGVVGFTAGACVMLTNQTHKWAHEDHPPAIARVLQALGLALRPTVHAVHHAAPYDRYYCITNGWTNAPVRWLRVFEIIEWCVTSLTGIEPEHRKIEAAMQAAEGSGPVTHGSV